MLRILMADDSPTVLDMLRAMLSADHYDILIAEDGENAVRLASAEKPDLVLLATILPGLNGYQVCRKLKSQAATAHIPVILVTSHWRESEQSRRAEQGVDGYLTRPFSPEQLYEVIRRFSPQATQPQT